MRCPKCGFISFDDLVACAKCNFQLEDKNAQPFEGTAIRSRHAISLRLETESEESKLVPAEEEPDAAEGIYQELAAESLGAGLTGENGSGEEEFDLSLADSEEQGEIEMAVTEEATEEISGPETAEEIPAVDLGSFDDEGPDRETTDTEEVDPDGADTEAAVDNQMEQAGLDLTMEGEVVDMPAEEEAQETEQAQKPAASLEDIDLSGLMGEEEVPAAAEPPEGENSDRIYDLSDLMTAEGNVEDALAPEAEGDQDSTVTSEGEMLDLTLDEEGGDTPGPSPKPDPEAGPDGEEGLALDLEEQEEESDEQEPSEASEAEMPPSGLSLENEEDA